MAEAHVRDARLTAAMTSGITASSNERSFLGRRPLRVHRCGVRSSPGAPGWWGNAFRSSAVLPPRPKEDAMSTKKAASRSSIDQRLDEAIERVDEAREELLAKDGVIGVGYGPKERDGKFVDGEVAIVVYVAKKKDEGDLAADDVVPPTIEDVPTDVVEIGSRTSGRQANDDRMWIDYGRLHELNPLKDVDLEPEVDFDLDDVAIVQIDDTFLSGNSIDLAKASKRFLASHPDIFDFITFFVDTASGLPGQGSFHSGVFNQTTGINYYAGLIDRRTSFGTTKLLAV